MRAATQVTSSSTTLFRATLLGGAQNAISVTVQNPSSNSDSIEIAWDDVDTPLVAGTGQILAPGDWRTIKNLPANANNNVGVLAVSLSNSPTVRVMQGATVV